MYFTQRYGYPNNNTSELERLTARIVVVEHHLEIIMTQLNMTTQNDTTPYPIATTTISKATTLPNKPTQIYKSRTGRDCLHGVKSRSQILILDEGKKLNHNAYYVENGRVCTYFYLIKVHHCGYIGQEAYFICDFPA